MSLPLTMPLATHWVGFGVADQIKLGICNETFRSQQLAGKILKVLSFAAKPEGHRVWLPLPRQRNRSEHVLCDGPAVAGGEVFALEKQSPHAVRVALGAARNCAELGQALYVLPPPLSLALQWRRSFKASVSTRR